MCFGASYCCLRHYHFTKSLVASPAHPTVSLTFMNPEVVNVTKWLSSTSKKHHPPTLWLLFTKQKNWGKQKSGLILLKGLTNTRHLDFCKVPSWNNPPSPPKRGTAQGSCSAGCMNLWQRALFQTYFRARSDAVLWKICRNFLVLSRNSWV